MIYVRLIGIGNVCIEFSIIYIFFVRLGFYFCVICYKDYDWLMVGYCRKFLEF